MKAQTFIDHEVHESLVKCLNDTILIDMGIKSPKERLIILNGAKNLEKKLDEENYKNRRNEERFKARQEGYDEAEKNSLYRSVFGSIWRVINMPYDYGFKYTIPNCEEGSRFAEGKWYILAFVMSIVWIAGLSFFMVEWASRVGCILNIDSHIMGITILAAGTSIPDALGSIIVAKQGFGDMAVSNAIGSNVFDILLGLGFPWLLSILIFGKPVEILSSTSEIVTAVCILFGILLLVIAILASTKWHLSRNLGLAMFGIYAVFVIYNILFGILKVFE